MANSSNAHGNTAICFVSISRSIGWGLLVCVIRESTISPNCFPVIGHHILPNNLCSIKCVRFRTAKRRRIFFNAICICVPNKNLYSWWWAICDSKAINYIWLSCTITLRSSSKGQHHISSNIILVIRCISNIFGRVVGSKTTKPVVRPLKIGSEINISRLCRVDLPLTQSNVVTCVYNW